MREVPGTGPLGGRGRQGAAPHEGEFMIKRVLAAAAVVAALGAVAAPASAGQVCLTTDVNVNGTPSPLNGTNCVDTP